MIDSLAVKALMDLIDDAVNGIGEICEKEDIPDPVENGMKLLTVCNVSYRDSLRIVGRCTNVSKFQCVVLYLTKSRCYLMFTLEHFKQLMSWSS